MGIVSMPSTIREWCVAARVEPASHYRRAVAILATTKRPLRELQTHVLLPLERVEHGIQLLSGEATDARPPLNIVIEMEASSLRGFHR